MTLLAELKSAWDFVSSIEPARGTVSREELRRVEGSIKGVEDHLGELDELDDEALENAERALSVLYARGAALAIAAGEEFIAQKWFDAGESHATDDAYAAQFASGRGDPERFRKLVHGRWLIANRRERQARKLWSEVVKAKTGDALATAALAEQKAPRPLDGANPTLYTLNGFGAGFAGSRDRWSDGSYATTHCIKLLFIPVFPLSAYRVMDGEEHNQYYILAREPLSAFAKAWRWIFAAGIAVLIAGYAISAHYNDPDRLARNRWDDTLEHVAKQNSDAALAELDQRLADGDAWRVGTARVQKVGAEIMRISIGKVTKPFTAAQLDQAQRVVRRFQALADNAKDGPARDALLAALDQWRTQLGPNTTDAHLQLLEYAQQSADSTQASEYAKKLVGARLAVADTKAEDAPLEALAVYVANAGGMARATKVIERLVETPALLVDGGPDVAAWINAQPESDALRQKVAEKLDAATVARAESQTDGVTPKQLEAQLKKNPWNQWAVLGLATHEATAGKLEAAAQRLRAIGKPSMMVREVRQSLGQLASALGKLDEADELLSGLLGARLPRFQKVATELDDAATKLRESLIARLERGDVPFELERKLQTASEADRRELLLKWVSDQMESDPTIKAKREEYLALGDVVPACLAAGGVKLRRAQAMTGAERDAMLAEAEHLFLAIRTEAEGQPEFKLGLGEVYARLGKTKESEEQLKGVLDMHKPDLSLRVAQVYRGIGSTDRAKQVAEEVYNLGVSPAKENAAVLLGIMYGGRGEEDEAEKWLRRADQSEPFVRTSLLEVEAQRLMRAGKHAECAAKYSLIAKAHLKDANAMDMASFNNAAIAHENRYMCSGDPQALADAEATLEKAYRVRADQPIVVANLAEVLDANGKRRVLGKRIDIRALRISSGEADTLIGVLLESSERDGLLAELNADPGVRRGTDLAAQYEVLAPNSTSAYERQMQAAYSRRDEAALTALLARVKQAKGLEVSEAARNREKFIKGELDDKLREYSQNTLAHVDELLAKGKLDAKTRAAALCIAGSARVRSGLYANDPAELARGREALQESAKLWPALESPSTTLAALIDEAGLAADATAWIALRRERSAASSLAKLVAESSPIATKIRGSKQWSDVRALAQKDTSRPGVDDLRIARLLGDAAVEARAKAVLDDKLQHLWAEISRVLDPSSAVIAEDLAYLDAR